MPVIKANRNRAGLLAPLQGLNNECHGEISFVIIIIIITNTNNTFWKFVYVL